MDLGSPLPSLALVRCFQGGIAGLVRAVTDEDVPVVGPGDVAGSSEALNNDCIDRKME